MGMRRPYKPLPRAEDLPAVEQPGRVEGVLDRPVHLQRHRPDLTLQLVHREVADPVPAGDRAAPAEAQLEDVVERGERPPSAPSAPRSSDSHGVVATVVTGTPCVAPPRATLSLRPYRGESWAAS